MRVVRRNIRESKKRRKKKNKEKIRGREGDQTSSKKH